MSLFFGLLLCLAPFRALALDSQIETIKTLSSLGERQSGSTGAAKAADYIEAAFKSLGVGEVSRQPFLTPVIRYGEARLDLPELGKSLTLRQAALNALTPQVLPKEAGNGRIIYAARGEASDFNGKQPAGAIVLLDLDSGKNWQNAAELGAKAVIYVDKGPAEGKPAFKGVYEDKFEQTPIMFPRFWLSGQAAKDAFGDYTALGSRTEAPLGLIESKGEWENALCENILLFIPGTDPELSRQVVLFEAFYDSKSFVAGLSPGADEAASIAGLLGLAGELAAHPPKRSILLAATSGHAQSLAGMREFVAALRGKGKDLRTAKLELEAKSAKIKQELKALEELGPPSQETANALDKPELREAVETGIKDEVDKLSTRLMQLRLQNSQALKDEIQSLSQTRQVLRKLGWREDFGKLGADELAALFGVLPETRQRLQLMLDDYKRAGACVNGARDVRRLLGDRDIYLAVSLHLSSHGSGVGAFCEGFSQNFKPELNRGQSYVALGGFLAQTAASLEGRRVGEDGFYHDGLRASRTQPWRGYFADNPQMGGEVSALSGLYGLTLATVNDARPLWGTPNDTLQGVDAAYLERQLKLVRGLAAALGSQPLNLGDNPPRNGFSSLTGRVNFIRQGELFPDRPARGAVAMVAQGPSRFYAMVDADGSLKVNGLADGKHTLDKAIIEAYRFDADTGEGVWAMDKKKTGRESYRVKMRRNALETDLVMFGCRQSTLFSAIDPRTFKYFTKIELLDARREAEPLHYWFSRLDTLDSSLVSLFLEPGTPYKLTLSDSVLARKMLLLDSSADKPDGDGYLVDAWPLLGQTETRAASDMWNLLGPRIKNLEDCGIVNERIREMRGEGEGLLHAAEEALAKGDAAQFLSLSRSSWALAARVYNDVQKTQKDVLMGVLFYIALFIPFAFCAERLLFAFADIHKRIVAFMLILATVIVIVYNIHPAFKLTHSPIVVVLAFFILGLSAMVSMIIFFRFEREMDQLQRRAKHIKITEISKFKAFAAAFSIGVSNLRRRKVRTALTCVTLIILTFTIMSFTTVKSARRDQAVKFADSAAYRGLLLKNVGWQSLPPEALASLRDTYSGRGVVSPRAFLELKSKTSPVSVPVGRGNLEEVARGAMGFGSNEPLVSGLDRILTKGRWFKPGERQAVLLPETLARRLKVEPDKPGADEVTLWGMPFKVVGLFAGRELDAFLDLDGEPLTPVVFPSETAVEVTETEQEAIESGEDVRTYQGRYEHVPAEQTVIVPYVFLEGLGAELKSAAISGTDKDGAPIDPSKMADRLGLAVYSGESGGGFVYHVSDTISYAGAPNILIPLIISVLIVLNTMIGSVYERKREIGVYTAVGLAPTHVSFLFIAESLAFAVLSVVMGYLLAQTMAGLLSGAAIWKGLTANYSSLAGVAAMLLVVGVVLVSVIYPSMVAADIAIPDVNRSWSLPDPLDGRLRTTLPFMLRILEQDFCGGFIYDYYYSHQDVSHGLFSTDQARFDHVCPWGGPGQPPHPGEKYNEFRDLVSCLRVTATVWLAPFDFGIKQNVTISFVPALWHPGYMEIEVEISREAGEAGMWKRLNKGFLNDLRKQLLIWRSLDEQARGTYETMVSQG